MTIPTCWRCWANKMCVRQRHEWENWTQKKRNRCHISESKFVSVITVGRARGTLFKSFQFIYNEILKVNLKISDRESVKNLFSTKKKYSTFSKFAKDFLLFSIVIYVKFSFKVKLSVNYIVSMNIYLIILKLELVSISHKQKGSKSS